MVNFEWLNRDSQVVAKDLLGCTLIRDFKGGRSVKLKIVETESYDQEDAASHSYRGSTSRTEVMFGPAGYLYVYFTYGKHYCMNIVVGSSGYGAAVLIRALEPLNNIDALRTNRLALLDKNLTNGPAKLTEALKIDSSFNGHDLSKPPLRLIKRNIKPVIVTTTRIGISKQKGDLKRFFIKDNPYVSR